jgi:hypothetical protein
VAQFSNSPTGNLVRVNSQTGPWVVVPTRTGIDAFDANTGVYADTFEGAPGGYQQVAAIPSKESVGPPIIYGLRTGGEWVDIFVGLTPTASIHLPGPATYMSVARPGFNDQILLGSIKNNSGPAGYLSAVINTGDNSIRYVNQGTEQLVNGIVWSPDGARAYLSSTNLDGTGGAIGTYTASSDTFTNTAMAPRQTPKQIAISRDGSKLYVATVDNITGQGTYQILDTGTLSTTGSVNLGSFTTFGYGDVGPSGSLFMPPGPNGQSGVMQIGSTVFGDSDLAFVGNSNLPFLGTLVVDLPVGMAAISGFDQKTYVGGTFDNPVQVVVVDSAGSPLPDQQVTFTLDSDNGSFIGWGPQALITTGPDGKASSPPIRAGANPGSLTAIATVTGLQPATVALSILPPAVPPSVTSLGAGDGKIIVAFTPGDGHGISPPTGFTVTAYDSASQKPAGPTAQGSASPIAVTGLSNGKSYTFTVTANTPLGNWTSAMSPAINVGIPATITGTPPAGEVGKPYRFTFTVAGAPTPTVSFDNDATPLPDGLTFDTATATISGTPTTAGSTWLSFTATNSVGTAEDDPTLVIGPASTLGGSGPTATPSSSTSSTPTSAGASHSLPATGTSVDRLIGAAVLLVFAGAVLFLLARLRKTAIH